MATKEVEKQETTWTPKKDWDKASKLSANDIFYKSHVSGFSGIKKKYQAN